jgi:hypothetical protein
MITKYDNILIIGLLANILAYVSTNEWHKVFCTVASVVLFAGFFVLLALDRRRRP